MKRAVLLVLVVLVAACGGGEDEPAPGPSTSASPSPTRVESPETATAPLTGVETTDLAVTKRPVIAVKVGNSEAARPQSGLDAADLVFEELTEGGITRFVALFQSTVPERVGPVRSGRPEDAKMLPAYDPMLFMSGARDEVIAMLRDAGLTFGEEDGDVLYRDPSRRSPHNLYAQGENLFAAASGAGVAAAEPTGWRFTEDPPRAAVSCPECEEDPGATVTIPMSHVARTTFTYDARSGNYLREQDGAPQTVTGPGRVEAANVVVMETDVRQTGCCDSAGNPLSETTIVGEGRAVILRDGRRYEASWSKAGPDEHFRFTLGDGTLFAFKPGPTWLLLAPGAAVPPPVPER